MYVITRRTKVSNNGNVEAFPANPHTVTPCRVDPPPWAIEQLKELGVLLTMDEAVKRGLIEADGSQTAETNADALAAKQAAKRKSSGVADGQGTIRRDGR